MNVLSIGNSFSQDATRYINGIAKADGVSLTTVNLCIGGCSLDKHFRNMLSDSKAYELEVNGVNTDFFVSAKEALLNREWDFIALQQVSHLSPNYETYQPYLSEISAYIKTYAPKAKQVIHQTWAYEQGSKRLCEELGYSDQADMYKDIKAAYNEAVKAIDADRIIPSGEVFQRLIANGIEKIHRDTFHAKLGIGRYALGLTWYKILTGNSIDNIEYNDFDETVSKEEIAIIKKSVNEATK